MKDDTNLLDFPCSRAFRSYEAEIGEGISLPHIDPPETNDVPVLSDFLKKVDESLKYFGNRLQQESAKFRFLENKLNDHLDIHIAKAKKKTRAKKYD